MRAFITGITGFAGRHLAHHLLSEGMEVWGCANSAKWPQDTPSELKEQVPLVPWDLRLPAEQHPELLAQARALPPDQIYHLAAISVPSDCGQETMSPLARAVNVEGTRHVMQFAQELTSPPRLLFTSSCYVYDFDPENPIVQEDSPLGSRKGYGQSKLEAERLVQDLGQQSGIDYVIARSFNHSGPGQVPRMMLPEWAEQFAQPNVSPVRVRTLDAWLDLSDVRDIVKAYHGLLERGHSQGIYNVGGGKNLRSGDILQALRELADPTRPVVETNPGYKQEPIADITRLKEHTGWEPSIPLSQTLIDTLDDWRHRIRLAS
ncbi:Oxidoreductase [Planctomycetales bacterium 10988]|nr:Oxidoreductase [Planctomycetales bacterium 10988]